MEKITPNNLGASENKTYRRVGKNHFWYDLSQIWGKDMEQKIRSLYLDQEMCAKEISEYVFKEHGLLTSYRNILGKINELGITRTYGDAKKIAIKKRRMIYRKKREEEKYRAKSISAGTRLFLLEEAEYRCSLCGNGREQGVSLEIHHKDFNEKNNDINNYQVVCFLCHRGLHEIEKEKMSKG